MTEAISQQRLDEIRQRDASLRRVGAVLSPAQSDRRNLLADRDRLAARVVELEGNWRAIQGWTRSNLQTLDSAQRDWRQSSENAAKQAVLGDLSRCLEHLTEPQPAAAPDRAEGSQQ